MPAMPKPEVAGEEEGKQVAPSPAAFDEGCGAGRFMPDWRRDEMDTSKGRLLLALDRRQIFNQHQPNIQGWAGVEKLLPGG